MWDVALLILCQYPAIPNLLLANPSLDPTLLVSRAREMALLKSVSIKIRAHRVKILFPIIRRAVVHVLILIPFLNPILSNELHPLLVSLLPLDGFVRLGPRLDGPIHPGQCLGQQGFISVAELFVAVHPDFAPSLAL
ncbi:hypothetical protein V8F06_014420 [Rhypophila decipiens]